MFLSDNKPDEIKDWASSVFAILFLKVKELPLKLYFKIVKSTIHLN